MVLNRRRVNLNIYFRLLKKNKKEWRSALCCFHSVLLHQLTNLFTSFYLQPYRLRSVGIATGYGLDGPGIESRPALEPTQPPVQRVPGLSVG
jgi:hypothetical protein